MDSAPASMDERLWLSLVGVPVEIRSREGETTERLRVCYGASLRHGPPPSSNGSLVASICPEESRWIVRVGDFEERLEDRVSAIRTLNHELMMAVIRRVPEHFYVHAGVVSFRSRVIVLPGLSRSGKSTLALALLLGGGRFLSDELLVYDIRRNRLLCFPRAIKIRDACVGYFPSLLGHQRGDGEGRFLRMEALGQVVIEDSACTGMVVVPRFDPGGDDRLYAISKGEALLHLTSSALNFGAHRAESLDHLTSLVSDLSAFQLSWRDPHAAAARMIETLLEERT